MLSYKVTVTIKVLLYGSDLEGLLITQNLSAMLLLFENDI